MPTETPQHQIRVAILQRVSPNYRGSLFTLLASNSSLKTRLFVGEDIPNSKVRNASELPDIDTVKMRTKFYRIGSRTVVFHRHLIDALEEFNPDVILCEGESHPLGYIQAMRYRRKHKSVKLIHWGAGGLPGQSLKTRTLKNRLLKFIHGRFDVMIVYSSFAKDWLISSGYDSANIHVATNVGPTDVHMTSSTEFSRTCAEARTEVGLPQKFTVLYAGSLDQNKRPDLIVDLARDSDPYHYNYVLLGDGPQLEPLRRRASEQNLNNVYLPGNVGRNIHKYFRASDVLVVPGRGGVVISEAMAWGMPVVVHNADGTEGDLVVDGENGRLLSSATSASFLTALEEIRTSPTEGKRMGQNGRNLILDKYSVELMAQKIAGILQTTALQ